MGKSIVISFRVKPYQLAKALDGLKHYDKSFYPEKLSQIAKETFKQGVGYLTEQLPLEPSIWSQEVLESLSNQIDFGRTTREQRFQNSYADNFIKDYSKDKDQTVIRSNPNRYTQPKEIGNHSPESPKQRRIRECNEHLFDEHGYPEITEMHKEIEQIKESKKAKDSTDNNDNSNYNSGLSKDIETKSQKSVVTDFNPMDMLKDLANDDNEDDSND